MNKKLTIVLESDAFSVMRGDELLQTFSFSDYGEDEILTREIAQIFVCGYNRCMRDVLHFLEN